jgi:integrase
MTQFEPSTAPANLRELIRRYTASPEGKRASVKTDQARKRTFKRAIHRWPTLTLGQIEARGFRANLYDWRDAFLDRPAEGLKMIQTISTVFNWAVDRGWLRDNPAAAMKTLYRPMRRADDIWHEADLKALLAAAPAPLKEVVLLAVWTGLREGDILSLTADMFQEGWLIIRPAKTRRSSNVTLHIPYHLIPPLVRVVWPLLTLEWKAGEPLLRRANGSRWGDRALRHQLDAAKEAAGLGESPLRFHDFRGTLITHLYEAGCTDAEVGSISGHAIAKGNAKAYVARTRQLAENAFTKLAAYIEEKA